MLNIKKMGLSLFVVGLLFSGCGGGGSSSGTTEPIQEIVVHNFTQNTNSDTIAYTKEDLTIASKKTIDTNTTTSQITSDTIPSDISDDAKFEYEVNFKTTPTQEEISALQNKPLMNGDEFLGIVDEVKDNNGSYTIITRKADEFTDVYDGLDLNITINPSQSTINRAILRAFSVKTVNNKSAKSTSDGSIVTSEGLVFKVISKNTNNTNTKSLNSSNTKKESVLRIEFPKDYNLKIPNLKSTTEDGKVNLSDDEYTATYGSGTIKFNTKGSYIEVGLETSLIYNVKDPSLQKLTNAIGLTTNAYYDANLEAVVEASMSASSDDKIINLLLNAISIHIPILTTGLFVDMELMPVVILKASGEVSAKLTTKVRFQRDGTYSLKYEEKTDSLNFTKNITGGTATNQSIILSGSASGSLFTTPAIDISPSIDALFIKKIVRIGHVRPGFKVTSTIDGEVSQEYSGDELKSETLTASIDIDISGKAILDYKMDLAFGGWSLYTMSDYITGYESSSFDIYNYTYTNNEYIHNISAGTITSPTGKVWMDKNLGATVYCSSFDDSNCYGDYYQWGRNTDGHEKSNSSTTSNKSNSLIPTHGNFIKGSSDWTYTDSDGSIRKANWNPCPSGYRIPTKLEILNENNMIVNNLKLARSGDRNSISGSLKYVGTKAFLWSSDIGISFWDAGSVWGNGTQKYNLSVGFPIRCIKQ